jgi:chemotaxis protein methyltransferase CheR
VISLRRSGKGDSEVAMAQEISGELMGRFSEFVAARLGLDFQPARWHDLERAVRRASAQSGRQPEDFLRGLLGGSATPSEFEALVDHLTVGETYFWREKESLLALQEQVLPVLIEERRRAGHRSLRLWSAGCCSGEEAYSLAILLHRLLPDLDSWQVSIAATDLNARFLDKARAGLYGEWSFRSAPPWLKDLYFERVDSKFLRIKPSIARMVRFFPLNMAGKNFASQSSHTQSMDVILCRNVLIYFSEPQRQSVAGEFYNALLPGGWLVVGPSETSQALFSRFTAVNFPGSVFYRKPTAAASTLIAPPAASTCTFAPAPVPAPSAVEALFFSPPRVENMAASTCTSAVAEVPTGAQPRGAQDVASGLVEQAREMANAGALPAACDFCERALEVDKMNAGYHYLHATILQEQGEAALAAAA